MGKGGKGILAITNGGKVSSTGGAIAYGSGSTGNVTVHGANSTWTSSGDLDVGGFGKGTLAITNGAQVSSASTYVGSCSGRDGRGSVTVDGTNSTWTNSGRLYVGYCANGTLAITNGAQVFNTKGSIGDHSGSTGNVTVHGANSTWTNSSELYVGVFGNGTLAITNGGKASNANGYIGSYSGSTGRVTVSGIGSTWMTSNNLYIGGSESIVGVLGTVNVTDGGWLSVGGTLQVWQTGTLYVNGGTLSAGALTGNGTIHVSGPSGSAGLILGSTVNSTFSGTLADGSTPASLLKVGAGAQTLSGNNTYSGGTTVQAGSLLATNTKGSATGLGDVDVQGGAILGGNGTIGASGSTVTIQNNGTLAPGMSPGTLHIAGDLDLEAGAILAFELNDPDSTTLASDKLLVAETFSTEPGVLMDLALQNGYTPELGDAWTVVEYANFSGNASDVTVRSTLADPDLSYNLAVVGNSLVLSVVPEPATIATIGSGLLTLAGLWWHRRRRRAPGGLLASLRPSGRAASGHRSMSRVGPDHSRSHRSPHRKRRSSGHPH